jgi:diguanylate cyclase (GGDEF)-like protein
VSGVRVLESGGARVKLLIADDDPLTCRTLENKLQARGYATTIAMNGPDAWQALQAEDAPRIAVLDWMMPGLSGIEICRRLRSATDVRYTYVVLATGRTAQEDLIDAFEAGADDYVKKPVQFAELEARLRTGIRVIELEQRLLAVQAELQVRATRDPLTSAWNRGAIVELLERELSRCGRVNGELSIALVDIDHFKSVNDRFGHAGGDLVLVEVVRRLQRALRPYDTIGRYGGEEFLVIMPNCAAEAAYTVAERLRQELAAHPILVGETELPITASFGVASVRGAALSGDALTRNADTALYEAKRKGRNRVIPA